VQTTDPIIEAAHVMAAADVGSVVVMDGASLFGIVTDRDIAVRGVAAGLDPRVATVAEISSHDIVTVDPDTTVDDAIDLMRRQAVRRLPVVDTGQPIGIVSIGDIALRREPHSALGEISAAPPNR
jgi:CBS domain-containing protein